MALLGGLLVPLSFEPWGLASLLPISIWLLARSLEQRDWRTGLLIGWIFGLVVDRPMLSRVFGGLVAVVYIILKDTADRIIAQYAPPTPMTMGMGGQYAGQMADRVGMGGYVDTVVDDGGSG
jgi:hypothetical protein